MRAYTISVSSVASIYGHREIHCTPNPQGDHQNRNRNNNIDGFEPVGSKENEKVEETKSSFGP